VPVQYRNTFSAMKIALVAIVLAAFVVHGEKPKPQSNAHTQSSTNAKQEPSSPTSPSVVVVNQNAAKRESENHPDKSPHYLMRLFSPENLPNIALVIVGIAGIIVAICTLKDIQKQTTNTETAANAARLNAQSVVNAERPWLVVRPFIKKKENPRLCSFGCRNQGITPAKIISASAKYVFVNIPDELWRKPPDYSFPVALPDLTLIVHHDSFPIGHGIDAESLIGDGETKARVDESRNFLIYYGNVVYRDVLTGRVLKRSLLDERRYGGQADHAPFGTS
jgi:hypothetical protein